MNKRMSSSPRKSSSQRVGLWIDHREAVIVMITGNEEQTTRITSGMEKHIRYSGGSHEGPQEAEDMRDRKFENHLGEYYDGIVARIRDAESIQIFGPGEAKGELEKHLQSKGLGSRIAGVETVDKMTDRQIAEKVRQQPGTKT